MKTLKKKLIKFETKVANLFNNQKIKAPIHLYHGNEEKIINIFKNIRKRDWVFCSWRSHYQCLLKGVPEKLLLKKILQGKSIALTFKNYRIISSAIVGGVLPIAVGTAIGIKKSGMKEKVYCFLGDMTSETGIAHECIKYSINYNLPIQFIIEDNNLSVCSDTRLVWNLKKLTSSKYPKKFVHIYKYKNKYPHAGSGTRIQF
jgi:TPP-dependent pyruvate/acetoin dehydrogenase alpha subunit